MAVVTTPFVPADFEVPASLVDSEFVLKMLSVDHVVRDYDAVMTSVEHLKGVWPGGTWPEGLTLKQNLIDLGWHEKEFQLRQSFAYTVLSPDEARVTGCVYINPSRKQGHDAAVYLWARQSELACGMEERLYAAVRAWLAAAWPFASPAFPGRDVSWDEWRAKEDKLL
jgi:hypothetical protein